MRDVLVIMYPVVDITVQIDDMLPIEAGQLKPMHRVAQEPGGGANIIFTGTRLGLDIVHVGAVGQDSHGDFLKTKYSEEGTDNSYIQAIPGFETQVVICLNDNKGNHAYISNLKGCRVDVPDDLIEKCRAILVSGYMLGNLEVSEGIVQLIKRTEHSGKTIFFDPGPTFEQFQNDTLEIVLAATDYLILNHIEAEGISGAFEPEKAAPLLAQRTRGIVVIKSGSKGCYMYQNGVGRWYNGFSVPVIDTVGAGDTFLGAFMRGVLDGWDIGTTCLFANAAGAAKVQKQGSGTQVPTIEEIHKILNKNRLEVSKEQLLDRTTKLVLKNKGEN